MGGKSVLSNGDRHSPRPARPDLSRFGHVSNVRHAPSAAITDVLVRGPLNRRRQRLLATHSRYLHETIVELAERLKATLPPCLDAVFVVNSGSEANDQVTRAPATVQARRVTEALHERGILLGTTGPARNVVKIRPPSSSNANRPISSCRTSKRSWPLAAQPPDDSAHEPATW